MSLFDTPRMVSALRVCPWIEQLLGSRLDLVGPAGNSFVSRASMYYLFSNDVMIAQVEILAGKLTVRAKS